MNFTNATHYPTLRRGSQSPPAENLSVATKQAVYWAVATIALVGNLFFCTSLLKQRRTIFRKPYTIIVFSLALTDIITSILLFISPRFVFQDTFPQPSSMVGLRFFCVLIWGRTPLFCFALVSMYLTILLTVDRWFAVVRPTEYHTRFTRKKALASIALLSAVAIMVMVGSTPKFHFYAEKPPGQRCGFAKINPGRFQVTSTVSFVFKTVLPFLAIAALYIHMWYKLKTSSLVTQQHSPAIKKRITKVAAMSTLLLFISWTPNQIAFLCFSYGKLPLLSTTMDITTILVFVNSCVNPFLYGLTVRKYREASWELMTTCCPCVLRLRARRVGQASEREQGTGDQ